MVTKRKPRKKVEKFLPLIVVTTQDKQTFTYALEGGFMTAKDFKLFDSLLGKKIQIQFGRESKQV